MSSYIIILKISSTKKKKNIHIKRIAALLHTEIEISSYSWIQNNIFEYGLSIKTLNIFPHDYKIKIWFPLKLIFPEIRCGFIDSPDYKGCIRNWPNVFRKSKCILPNIQKSKL